ncbi:MAG: thiamine-phosphate kinase [Mariprofundales bacterium]|nr:thiamine-phosphate kinase [Mariprofundales bacterium]
MTVAEEGEFELISRLFLRRGTPDDLTEVANGDDASVHRLPMGESLVVSCDSSMAAIHWPEELVDLQSAAGRAVQVALSDLAAMGAQAHWCWVALMAVDGDALAAMGEGVVAAVAAAGVQLAGGDCVRASGSGLTVTVAGSVTTGQAMCRSGAQIGDGVWLFGQVGWAAAGLRMLMEGGDAGSSLWLDAFLNVRARLGEGQRLRQLGVRCCIDVSDGLLQDAHHLAYASGVRLVLSADGLPQLPQLRAAWSDGLDLALTGGEDYALLCCAGLELARELEVLGGVRIGEVVAGSGVEVSYQGAVVEGCARGFDHFASAG